MAALHEKLDSRCYLFSSFALGLAGRKAYSNKMFSCHFHFLLKLVQERVKIPNNTAVNVAFLVACSIGEVHYECNNVHTWGEQKILQRTPQQLCIYDRVYLVFISGQVSAESDTRKYLRAMCICLCWLLVLWPKVIFQKTTGEEKVSASLLKVFSGCVFSV